MDEMRKLFVKHTAMFVIVVIIALVFLKLANEDSFWINVAWVTGVWFGMETVLFLDWVKEYQKAKNI